jgi:hypothetical protein
MRRSRFIIAVAATSLGLVAVLGLVGFLTARSVLAGSFGGPGFGPGFGGHGFGGVGGGPGFEMPPELEGLKDLPPAERFAHFRGVQLNLTDRNNQPLTVTATPGKATAVSATSLTIAANDGTTKTYTLDGSTFIRGRTGQGGAQATQQAVANNDLVVVVTANNSNTARAVMNGGTEGFGPRGGHGPWRPGR